MSTPSHPMATAGKALDQQTLSVDHSQRPSIHTIMPHTCSSSHDQQTVCARDQRLDHLHDMQKVISLCIGLYRCCVLRVESSCHLLRVVRWEECVAAPGSVLAKPVVEGLEMQRTQTSV